MNVTRTSLPIQPMPLREVPRPPRPVDATAGDPAAAAPTGEASLWEVLTPEEREFFAQQAALGPLTYGRTRQAPALPQSPLGQRLDVRG